MHVRGLDWVKHQPAAVAADELAEVALDTNLSSGSAPAALFPTDGGNIHQLTAITPCAVLDLLAPPYNPSGGRLS